METLDTEKKYIEERVCILKALEKRFGNEVLEIASDAKKKTIALRIREKYKRELPVDMHRFFEIIFGDFEGIDRIIDFEVVKKRVKSLKSELTNAGTQKSIRTWKLRILAKNSYATWTLR